MNTTTSNSTNDGDTKALISNVVAWMGTCSNGSATIVTTDQIQVDKWKQLGLTIIPLIKQPAELAEQQGVIEVATAYKEGRLTSVAAMDRIISALTATGKQQVRKVQGNAREQRELVRKLTAMMNTATEGDTYILHEAITALAVLLAGVHPVAVLRFDRETPGRENEMPLVLSCQRLPDGEYPVYIGPPTQGIDQHKST